VNERKLKILLVDDLDINLQILNLMLHHDYEIFMATSGEQAISMCGELSPDLILLDVVMPGMNGHEVCRYLKSHPITANIPIIFVTTQSNSDDESAGFEAGAVDFISKPINEKVVRARVRTHLKLKVQNEYLEAMAMIDGLTLIANRRSFDEKLDVEWRQCRRSQAPLSVVLIDIDYFKLFNDCYGHQAGDRCLQTVAMSIKSCLKRPHDLVARYGGEEFVCILPECDLIGATRIAETMCQAILELAIPHSMSRTAPFVTISAGVASNMPDENAASSELITEADKRMYKAKMQGRNRVCCG